MSYVINLVIGVIFAIVKHFVKKGLTIKFIIPFQLMIASSIISINILFFTGTLALLMFIYNKISDFANWIQSFDFSNQIFVCVNHLLTCSGLAQVIEYSFVSGKSLIFSFLLLELFKLFITSMRIISDEVWKLGLLLKD